MKNILKYTIIAMLLSGTATLQGCSDPTEDKDGNEVSLIKVDFPKFDAKYIIELYSKNGNIKNPVTGSVNVQIKGKSASKLVNENGRIFANMSNNSVKNGILSLNLNPNIKISASDPTDFTVSGENANYLILDKNISQTIAGDKIISVEVIELGNLRAAMPVTRAASDIVTVSGSGFTKVQSLKASNSGNGYDYISLYKASSTGATITVDGPSTGYEGWGVYVMGVDNIAAAPRKTGTITIPAGKYFVTAAKAANLINGKVTITLNGPVKSSTSFNYEITAGSEVYTGTLSGTLPLTSTIEQIFVPNNTQATVKITPNAPYTIATASKNVAITSSSSVTFDVNTPIVSNDIKRCDITIVGFCTTDKQIGYSITRKFQYRLANSNDTWQWGEILSGKCTMFLKDKSRYTFRIAVNDDMISYDISTDRQDITDIITGVDEVTKYVMKDISGGYSIEVQVESSELCGITG